MLEQARERTTRFQQDLKAAKIDIAIEVMDTGAAARTYNVLLQEGRKVTAALIAI